jgi:type IV pilus assembly protein PilC
MKKSAKLTIYYWQGKNKQGENLSGELAAANLLQLKIALRRQGIILDKVQHRFSRLLNSQRISSADITRFSRQLATLLTASIPIIQAFELLARGQIKLPLQNVINRLKNTIEKGHTVAESLRAFPIVLTRCIAILSLSASAPACWTACLSGLHPIAKTPMFWRKKLKKR